MNMKGVILHVLGDALGSVVVVVSAIIMWQLEGEAEGRLPRLQMQVPPAKPSLLPH